MNQIKPVSFVNHVVKVPCSKSHAQRAIALSLCTKGTSRIKALSDCEDIAAAISIVKSLGPTREDILNQQGIYTISDILYHFPRKHLDRTVLTAIKKLVKGNIVNVFASVETYGYKSIRRGKIFQVIVSDRTGILTLSWFNGGKYIKGMIKKGQKLAIFGKVDWYQGFVMTHPEFEILDDKDEAIISGGVIPIYPLKKEFLSAGLGQRRLRVIIKNIRYFISTR